MENRRLRLFGLSTSGSTSANGLISPAATIGIIIYEFLADVRCAWWTLRRSPSFAVVAVLSLALGIGVDTQIFSIVNSLVLEPLPVADPDRVVFVQNARESFVGLSFPNYRDLRDRQTRPLPRIACRR